ncbi:hypothetical protein A3F08_02245 [Candidatus Berkelbacteria bacterium RIFCSPHIGHO2_12_FULL_36_9]|uniref:Sortase n=1 Tax=Candidatus Berkelbacteria bacterium RIFCSPHIGHO2_12_FULL_36_9 TaxID=1797469 RepID=A0A1F5EGH3_9BACT|nr:MAG: hypothetical protein A3F08_02245 [Candidatus Berkelbacteria bacterium RIFCSPHIGHO2_12_FULL_36_9]
MDEEKPLIDFSDAEKLFSGGNKPEDQYQFRQLSEEDEEINPEKTARMQKLKTVGFWIVVVVLAFLTGYLIVNGPAYGKKVVYWYRNLFNKEMGNSNVVNTSVKVDSKANQSTNEKIPNDRLIIPKIGVDASINWNVEENQIQDMLLKGIVHYKTSSLPGKEGGNVFLTGHSSNYWWIQSQYNQVFALLDNLQSGDKIVATYENKKYVYAVYDKFVVKPTQIEVIEPLENKTTLTLMSCVPIGTNLRRLIVRSKLLYADLGNNQLQADSSEPAQDNISNQNTTGEQPVNVSNPQERPANDSSESVNPNSDFYLPNVR